jgi:hypothetical protein
VQEALPKVPFDMSGTGWRYLKLYNFDGNDCKIGSLCAQETVELVRGYPPVHIFTAYSWKV